MDNSIRELCKSDDLRYVNYSSEAIDGTLSSNEFISYLGLASSANNFTNRSFIGAEALSYRIGLTRQTISKSFRKLEKLGLIEAVGNKGRAVEYKIVLDNCFIEASFIELVYLTSWTSTERDILIRTLSFMNEEGVLEGVNKTFLMKDMLYMPQKKFSRSVKKAEESGVLIFEKHRVVVNWRELFKLMSTTVRDLRDNDNKKIIELEAKVVELKKEISKYRKNERD